MRAPAPGLAELPPFPRVGQGRSFVSGEPDGDRIRIRYFRRESDNAVVATVRFGPGAEGPPNHAHGGAIAAVLDECMGTACWLSGNLVLMAKLTTNYRRPVPLNSELNAHAWVEKMQGRKVFPKARLLNQDGAVLADAEGLCIVVADSDVQGFLEPQSE